MELRKRIIIDTLEQTDSTNDWLRINGEMTADCLMRVVTAEFQTDGRGQQGNHWESEKSANLLFSIKIAPKSVDAGGQFILSQAIALAITDSLAPLLLENGTALSVKWPNDIYWKEKKLGGILIENRLQGRSLAESIIGAGLNVNQKSFTDYAPNPVSVKNITGADTDRRKLLESILTKFADYLVKIGKGDISEIRRHYMESLFRRDGFYRYRDADGEFQARIGSVGPDGIITLVDEYGNSRMYEFKQVRCLFNNN